MRMNNINLWEGIRTHDVEKVALAIQSGANVNAKRHDKSTPLTYATYMGYTDIVTLLLSSKKIKINKTGLGGWTALIEAIRYGRQDIIDMLLTKGADIHVPCDSGSTALFYAACNRRLDVVKRLVSLGADVNAMDNERQTTLMRLSKGPGNIDCVDYLLKVGANPNLQDDSGSTALLYAVSNGQWETFNRLIDAGAELNTQNNFDYTALMAAAEIYQGIDYAKRLVSIGADVNMENLAGETAYDLALEAGNSDIASFLDDCRKKLRERDIQCVDLDFT